MASFDNRHYFRASEFTEPELMANELVSRLEIARGAAGVAFKITSSYRELTDGASTHEHGLGVDIDTEGSRDRYKILAALLAAGCTRIGVYTSDEGGHIHADIGDSVDRAKWAPEVLWLGKSR